MFTLAHFSDPHLGPLATPPWSKLISKRLTGYIHWQQKRRFIHDQALLGRLMADLKTARPDHIAATGDFANIGLPAEFEATRDFLSRLGAPADVTAVPGNHDAYVKDALPAMQTICTPFMRGDDGAGFPFARRRERVALIGVSSGVPTPPFVATGRVGRTQLGLLGKLLQNLERQGMFRVVLIHHPPVTNAAKRKRLIDRLYLMQTIAQHGAELLIHGHDHKHALVWLPGPERKVPAVGISSASAIARPGKDAAAYNLYRIDGEPGAWRCDMETRGVDANGDIVTLKRAALSG
ncbi:MAG: metallophosphoesterase family protein [Pseudolabrys sp.]